MLATSEAAAAKQCASVTLRLVTAYSLQQNDMPGSHLHELLVSLLGPLQALKQAADLLVLFPQLLGDIDFQNFFAQLAAEKLFSSGEHIAGQGSASIKARMRLRWKALFLLFDTQSLDSSSLQWAVLHCSWRAGSMGARIVELWLL